MRSILVPCSGQTLRERTADSCTLVLSSESLSLRVTPNLREDNHGSGTKLLE